MNHSQRGEAEFAFVLLTILVMCGALGFLLAETLTMRQCRDYGKTNVLGNLYDCKKMEEKK